MQFKFTFLLCFVLCSVAGFSQSEYVERLIDTSVVIMRSNAVNAAKVNWTKLRAEIRVKTKSIKHPYELGDIYRNILMRLDDFHGAMYFADSTFKWSQKEMVVSDSISNEWKKTIYLIPQFVSKKIGYLRIPSMSAYNRVDINARAQTVNDSLCYLLNQGLEGLIIDLRLNGGGSIHPMILGLYQLFHSGVVESFIGKEKTDWKIADNAFIDGTDTMGSIHPGCSAKASKIPVVILTGMNTGSSGEFLTIAFKGRPNTIIIGTETAGYITVTQGFMIDDYSKLLLSVGYAADRNGKVYKSALQPDIRMDAIDKFNDLQSDVKVQAATKWLNDKLSKMK